MPAISHPKHIGSYPQWSVITTVAITLFMIGLFSLFALYAGTLTKILKESIEVQVFIKKNLSPEDSLKVQNAILSSRFTAIKNGNPQYKYTSKEEAAQRMIAETGEDFVAFLGNNPLHDSYSLQLKEAYQHKEQLKLVKTHLETIEGVSEVAYTELFIDEIDQNINKLAWIIAVFVWIALFTVLIIINNAIRLALYSQRFIIRSMQLVGATAFFIKRPFLWRATQQGLIGGFLAALLLVGLLVFTHKQVPELNLLQNWLHISLVFVSLLLGGFVICTVSAYIAVTRYLRMSLDELY
jgi:cell division transport system permease protein